MKSLIAPFLPPTDATQRSWLTVMIWGGVVALITMSFEALARPHGPSMTHHPEGVHLSMERFSSLFEVASQRETRAQWSDPQVTIDLSSAQERGVAEITFTAKLSSSDVATRVVDLIPSSVHPISVWLDEIAQTPQIRGSFHTIPLPLSQDLEPAQKRRLKLTYPVRINRMESGALSSLIPLPPVANADIKVIDAKRAHFIPHLSLNSEHLAKNVRVRGALAVLIPAIETGPLLQREDLNVSLHASGEGADVKLTINTLLRGEMNRAWVPVAPAREALISAQLNGAPAITKVVNAWHAVWVEKGGRHEIHATVRVKVDRSSGQPQLSLSPQRAPRARLTLTLPGEREVTTNPTLPLSSEMRDAKPGEEVGLTPQDSDEHKGRVTVVSADLPPLQTLNVSWTEKRIAPEQEAPEYLSETYQLFDLQEGLLKGEAKVELDVIKGELKRLELEVPSEVVLYHLSGTGVEGWVTLPQAASATKDSPRRVRVTFGEARRGANTLSVKWQRVLSSQEPINMPLIRPLGAFQESGVIALYDGDRVGFTPAKTHPSADGSERLIPVGQESIPQRILQLKSGEKVSQAFRHVQAPTSLTTSATTERARELRFDAQLDTLYSLRDGAVRAQSQLLINLKSGRLESLVVALPSECSEPQISGPSINRVEPLPAQEGDGSQLKRYQIRFTRRLEGAVTLDIDAEQLIVDANAQLSFPRLIVEGAELTQGHLGLSAESGLEVTPTEIKELRRVTITEIPRAIRLRASSEVLYGYRFSRDWSLSAKLKRHKIIETLNAEATSLSVQSYLLESGQRVDLALYTIKNHDRRAVKIKLPPGSSIQEVLVNQIKTVARAEGAFVSIPIPQSQTSAIQIRYQVTRAKSDHLEFSLLSPTSDVRTAQISWDLFFSKEKQLWSWESELRKGDQYSGARLSFQGLNQHAQFTYDLMAANRAPLKLDMSLSGVISREIVTRLDLIAILSLLLISLRRGFIFAKRRSQRLNYLEVGGGLLLGAKVAIYLYQEPWYQLERVLAHELPSILMAGGVTFLIVRGYDMFNAWRVAQRERTLIKSHTHPPQVNPPQVNPPQVTSLQADSPRADEES